MGDDPVTRCTSIVVRSLGEDSTRAGVHHGDDHVVGKSDRGQRQAAAVHQARVSGDGAGRDELVHDAALQPDHLVLDALSEASDVDGVPVDTGSGELLWRRTAHEGQPKVARHLKSTHANPTPVTDGQYIVAFFGSEGLYCYGSDGELLWKKDLGVLSSGWSYDATYEWGFSASPILYRDSVIVQVDIQKGSYVAS